ncbi:hypothetical protein V470_11100 [Streptococcus sp. VT 162]|nr:hypothetical protein V470_11100 [Streptococcus sp. VT 162]
MTFQATQPKTVNNLRKIFQANPYLIEPRLQNGPCLAPGQPSRAQRDSPSAGSPVCRLSQSVEQT